MGPGDPPSFTRTIGQINAGTLPAELMMDHDDLQSALDPNARRQANGPVAPWEVTCVLFGNEWLLETTWSEHDEQWEVWVGCEGAKVGSLYLTGHDHALRLVDPEGYFDDADLPVLERRLEEELCERVWRGSESSRAAAVQSLIEQGLQRVALTILRGSSGNRARRQYLSLREELAQAGVDIPDHREDIEDAVATAFADESMPPTEESLTTGGIDGPYVIEHILGKDRREVEEGFIAGLHMEDFTYMTPHAVRYYVPVPLRLALREGCGELWIYLHSFLKRESNQNHLTLEQKRLVARWARYLARRWLSVPDMSQEANEARALAESYERASVSP